MKRFELIIPIMAAMLLCACGGKVGNAAGQDTAAARGPARSFRP